MNYKTGIAAALATLALAGCTTEQGPSHSQGPSQNTQNLCSADAATKLVGQAKMSDSEAMRLTNAKSVRQVGPTDPLTMDYNGQRLTIVNDPATNKIIRAICG